MTAPHRIRAVLFDLGGTLIDERDFTGWAELARRCYLDFGTDELAHAFGEVEEEFDRHPPELDQEAAIVEFWRRTLSRAAGREVTPATAAQYVAARRGSESPLALYSDARRCLDTLRRERRALGVISNSTSEARVRSILDRVGILPYFRRVVSSGTEGVAKPNPEIFRRAVERMGVAPAEAFYVGNLVNTDARAARAAGLHAAWLHRAATSIGDDPSEIVSLLEVPLCLQRIERAAPPRTEGGRRAT
jgi:putative hydrolase of the HAD superfamily